MQAQHVPKTHLVFYRHPGADEDTSAAGTVSDAGHFKRQATGGTILFRLRGRCSRQKQEPPCLNKAHALRARSLCRSLQARIQSQAQTNTLNWKAGSGIHARARVWHGSLCFGIRSGGPSILQNTGKKLSLKS